MYIEEFFGFNTRFQYVHGWGFSISTRTWVGDFLFKNGIKTIGFIFKKPRTVVDKANI